MDLHFRQPRHQFIGSSQPVTNAVRKTAEPPAGPEAQLSVVPSPALKALGFNPCALCQGTTKAPVKTHNLLILQFTDSHKSQESQVGHTKTHNLALNDFVSMSRNIPQFRQCGHFHSFAILPRMEEQRDRIVPNAISPHQAAVAGAVLGLVVPATVLTLLWFGVGFTIVAGKVDLTSLLWPSSRMILVGWCTTTLGIETTILAVLLNCLLYALAALTFRSLSLRIARVVRSHRVPR